MNTIINCLLPIKFGFIVVDETSLVEVPSLSVGKQTGKYRCCLCIICFTMQHIKFLIEINADLLMRNFSVALCLLKCLHSFLGLGILSCINTNILFCIYHHDVFSPSLFWYLYKPIACRYWYNFSSFFWSSCTYKWQNLITDETTNQPKL